MTVKTVAAPTTHTAPMIMRTVNSLRISTGTKRTTPTRRLASRPRLVPAIGLGWWSCWRAKGERKARREAPAPSERGRLFSSLVEAPRAPCSEANQRKATTLPEFALADCDPKVRVSPRLSRSAGQSMGMKRIASQTEGSWSSIGNSTASAPEKGAGHLGSAHGPGQPLQVDGTRSSPRSAYSTHGRRRSAAPRPD